MTKPPDELINSVLKKIRNLSCPDTERVELWEAATDWVVAYIELHNAACQHVDHHSFAAHKRLCEAIGRPVSTREPK